MKGTAVVFGSFRLGARQIIPSVFLDATPQQDLIYDNLPDSAKGSIRGGDTFRAVVKRRDKPPPSSALSSGVPCSVLGAARSDGASMLTISAMSRDRPIAADADASRSPYGFAP
jgi:hypothetical protein